MINSRIVVAIAQGKIEPWETIWLRGQLPTWINRYKNDFKIVNFSGLYMGKTWRIFDRLHEKNRYSTKYGKWQGRFDYLFVPWLRRNLPSWKQLPSSEVDEILIRTNSSYIFAGRRLLGTLNWFISETEFEFLFLTTTSSLVNLRVLEKRILEFDSDTFIYAGQLLGESPNEFVSGAGQLLNRKTAALVLENFKEFPHQMLNDAALGVHLRSLGVQPIAVPWIWIDAMKQVDQLNPRTLENTFHFRLKTHSLPREDDLLMVALHDALVSFHDEGLVDY